MDKSPELSDIVGAKKAEDVYDALITMPSEKRKQLAQYLKAMIGHKQPKTVSMGGFRPPNTVIFEQSEIENAVDEFKKYLSGHWEEGYYLKIEK